MILREWRARAAAPQKEKYPSHFRASVLPQLCRTEGFLGATMACRQVGNLVEFLVMTRWHSTESVRAFAGDDIHQAVVDSEAAAVLTTFDRDVRHYTVLESC